MLITVNKLRYIRWWGQLWYCLCFLKWSCYCDCRWHCYYYWGLTIIQGLRPSTAEGVPWQGPHRVGNIAIINWPSCVLYVLSSICEDWEHKCLQHARHAIEFVILPPDFARNRNSVLFGSAGHLLALICNQKVQYICEVKMFEWMQWSIPQCTCCEAANLTGIRLCMVNVCGHDSSES